MAIAFRSAANANSQTIVAPNDIEKGDILVLLDRAGSGGGSTPDLVIPAGFTLIATRTNNTRRNTLSYKLADGSEAGATLTGQIHGSGGNERKVLVVFSAGATSLQLSTFNEEATDGNPSPQSVLASEGTPPLVVIAAYMSSGSISPRTFSPAKDGEETRDGSEWLAWKIYNSSPADVTVDMDDEGNLNTLYSGYIMAVTAGAARAMMHYRRLRI